MDQRRLLHLDRPRRRSSRLGPAGRRPARARTRPAPARRRGVARAREELLIAEGSDWFWWYGDDHSSDHDLEFDDLFRRHLRNVYRALDKPIPEELFVTNITTEPPGALTPRRPGRMHPVVDGEVTSYFEWIGAGELEVPSRRVRCTRWPRHRGVT